MINCLMTKGTGLTDDVREFLFRMAHQMFQEGKERKSVKSPGCEALVQTKFRFAIIGSIYGTQFVADVETNNGKTYVKFIVQDADLNRSVIGDGEWSNSFMPPPEDQPGPNAWVN